MPKFIIVTQAYNAEKTLNRAVDSILNQTFTDFIYYIIENGSKDNTRNIILDYAKNDIRIIPVFREINHTLTNESSPLLTMAKELRYKYDAHSYFVNLDADDEYSTVFLETMLEFAEENRLDVAACSTTYIDSETGEAVKHRQLDRNIILEGRDFADKFPLYRNYTNTIWGKIYTLEVLQKCDFAWIHDPYTLVDSPFCLEAFRRAERAGILTQNLHTYYMYTNSASNNFSPYWFNSYKKLFENSMEYLLDFGELSTKNKNYLYIIYFSLVRDIIPRIENANVCLEKKLESLNEIFADETTKNLLEHWYEFGIYTNKNECLDTIKKWLYAQAGWENYYTDDILRAINGINKK